MSTIMSDDNSSIAVSDLARECGFNFGNDFTSFDRSAIASLVEGIHDRLHQLALSSNGFEKLDFIFDVTDYHAVNSQLADWSENIFPVMPIIEILDDATMRGALGAYSGEQNTIYLARSLVQRDGLTGLTQVMLEEYGHYLDQQFNPGGDTAGDEGELFRLTVLGEAIDSADLAGLRADNDWGTLNFDDTSTLVEFDNSIGTARNIGSLTTAQTFQDFVGSNDTNDYYRFSITQNASPFTLTLNGLSADADVQLLNGGGGVITSSARGGTASESINRTLNAGTYYVRVYPYGGANTNYALTLSADPGNAVNVAYNLGSLSTAQTFRNAVSSNDTNDYYRFSITQNASPFTLTLNGLSADADVQLLNGGGGVITSSARGGTASESINRTLNAGTYYVRVYPYGGANTNYALTLSADPGNAVNVAYNLGSLSTAQTFRNAVSSNDTNDYYRFSITQNASPFTLTLNGLSADADVQLLNGGGGVITSSARGGTASESINRTLNAGTYYVRVYPYGGANTNYALTLSADPGNAVNAAYNLGSLSTAQTFRNAVSSSDTNDYYRFSITQNASPFTLTLNGLSADADVQLLNGGGGVITSSVRGGTASESINRTLNAGTYYVRVYPYGGANTNYALTLSADPGNAVNAAYNLGSLSTAQTFRNAVSSSDTNDYYRFSITQNASPFTLTLNGLSADADVQLLNGGGGVITSSARGGTASESINRTLNAGTYYVRVYPYGGANTNYALTLSADPGNAVNAAYNLGSLSTAQTFRNAVSSSDTNDYYRFSITQNASPFTLTLNGLSADADVQLLNGGGGVITSSARGGTASESINRTLNAGTYYVRVYPYGGANTNYALTLSADPGNAVNAAYNLGSLSTAQTFRNAVSSSDTNDYYRFSITQNASPFTLTLNGLSADADVQLLNGGGGVITSSARGGTASESINRTLNAGTYYVRVYPYGGANTNYALTLSADWYGPNLHDAGITNLARQLSADGNLNRNDMISILRNAEDGNLIDATEVTDLRTLVSGRRVLMPDFVYNLTNKIVNGHEANRWWTGGSTSRQLLAPISPSQNGNLYAGATVSHMERLIGKWFLGLDRPAIRAGEQYRPVNGSLFRNGIQYQDVDQGGLGDCYLCAALAGAAFRNPTRIQNMFIDNGDDTYTVRFFNNGVADYVTVDRYLPTNNFGQSIYMGWGGDLNTATTNELWTGLAERAYAQMSESAWINRSSTNSYATISGGWPDTALNQITAQGTVRDLTLTNSDRTSIINQFNAGRTVFLNWATHALTMVGYNSATQLFRIYNPHGNEYNLTWQQILNGGNGSARYTDWSYSTTS
jgi:hypothetical protein